MVLGTNEVIRAGSSPVARTTRTDNFKKLSVLNYLLYNEEPDCILPKLQTQNIGKTHPRISRMKADKAML